MKLLLWDQATVSLSFSSKNREEDAIQSVPSLQGKVLC